jgi:translation elongation factor EF-4
LTIEGPWIKATILVPDAYLGPILALCEERRGEQVDLTYAGKRAMLTYPLLPLNEVVFDFYDQLKSVSRGYASFDYQLHHYREGDLVLMIILVNVEPVDASSARAWLPSLPAHATFIRQSGGDTLAKLVYEERKADRRVRTRRGTCVRPN